MFHPCESVDVLCIRFVVITVYAAAPVFIVATAYMYPETCHGLSIAVPFTLLHLLSYGGGVLTVDGEEVAYFAAVFQEEVIPPCIPSTHHHMLMAQHLALLTIEVALYMLVVGCRQQPQCSRIFCQQVQRETDMLCVAYLEIRVFVTESHGHDTAAMLTRPGINMRKLQQVVAHLAFVSCEYHFLFCLI